MVTVNPVFFFFGGLPFLILAVFLLLVISGKSEPDPLHERPRAIYLAALSYIAALILMSAGFFLVTGLVGFTGDGSSQTISISGGGSSSNGGSFTTYDDYKVTRNHDSDVAGIVGGLIAGAIAVGLLAFNTPKLRDYEQTPETPGARVYARYLYLVCFAATLVGLAAIGAAVYQLIAAIAPDTLGNGSTGDSMRNVASSLGFALVPGFLFLRLWSAATDLQNARRRALDATTVVPDEEPPPAPARRPRTRKATGSAE